MENIINPISTEEEYNLPDFTNHDDARKYFKDKYADRVQLLGVFPYNGERIYAYRLILNMEHYKKGIEKFEKNEFVEDNSEFLCSYQTIEISATGGIHILH